jgi:class 3 adenylate cyclase/CHASE2 domain-containing sensor protein
MSGTDKKFFSRPIIFVAAIGLIIGVFIILLSDRLHILSFFRRLDWIIYDSFVKISTPATEYATNLAAVYIDETTLESFKDKNFTHENPSNPLGYSTAWPFPRRVYGRLVRELTTQGAKAVAFDILFDQLYGYEPVMPVSTNEPTLRSDVFFAQEIARSKNVILATLASKDENHILPASLFQTNALALGDISNEPDSDGVLRRIRVFTDYKIWHPQIQQLAKELGVTLDSIRIQGEYAEFQLPDGTVQKVKIPDGSKPYEIKRIWHMGVVLAAIELGLNLDKAEINLSDGFICIPGTNGLKRVIPVDKNGQMMIFWNFHWNDPRALKAPLALVVTLDDIRRYYGKTNDYKWYTYSYQEFLEEYLNELNLTNIDKANPFKNKLVVVGSVLKGNNLSDVGATPLSQQTFLVSTHWNVANSIITGKFITRLNKLWQILILLAAILITLSLNLHWNAIKASVFWLISIIGYLFLSWAAFNFWLIKMPFFIPLVIGFVIPHICIVTCEVVQEQKERRRIKNVFSRLVAPEVVEEVLSSEQLSLGGTIRKVTVLFADIRGFTEMTDTYQRLAEEYIRNNNLSPAQAEEFQIAQARTILETVNLYLGIVAEKVKKHHGTLDKYIGDCVMAFWGAPILNQTHAADCVRAAIEAQQTIYKLNQERISQNSRNSNITNADTSQTPYQVLPVLNLGTGINTGEVIVGFMGSDEHILNYTVFGREVNLASRLEGVSGKSRIIISQSTYLELVQTAPELAAKCKPLPPVQVKGIHEPVNIYEVQWLD